MCWAGRKSRGWAHALTGVAKVQVEGGNLPIMAVGTEFRAKISAHLPARFGSDAGAYVRCGSGPATTANRHMWRRTALQCFSFLTLVSLIAATTTTRTFAMGGFFRLRRPKHSPRNSSSLHSTWTS